MVGVCRPDRGTAANREGALEPRVRSPPPHPSTVARVGARDEEPPAEDATTGAPAVEEPAPLPEEDDPAEGTSALMVNALQRASSIVVQNSIRAGFGLTLTEAMWKRIPVLANRGACGPRHQVRDSLDGRLVTDANDADELATALIDMLSDADRADLWGRSGQRHVHDRFLVFSQLQSWMELLATPS